MMIYQKTQETWDCMKNHSSCKGWAKSEDSSREEIQLN